MQTALTVRGLQKSYGTHRVLNDISFEVRKGQTFALLGANGAGKTTLLECMEGLRRTDAGEIQVNGRRGVQLQSSTLPAQMKVAEALRFFGLWQHHEAQPEMLHALELEPLLQKQYGQLSTGQKRRVHLALALLGEAETLFLDEPTAGLDVEGQISLHSEIRRLKQQGCTIVLASHDMAEVETLCDVIAILKDGALAFLGTPAELTKVVPGAVRLKVRFSAVPGEGEWQACRPLPAENGMLRFEADRLEDAMAELLAVAGRQNLAILELLTERPTLEERFLSMVREAKA